MTVWANIIVVTFDVGVDDLNLPLQWEKPVKYIRSTKFTVCLRIESFSTSIIMAPNVPHKMRHTRVWFRVQTRLLVKCLQLPFRYV